MSSRLQLDMRNLSLGRRHLVNAYEVEAGINFIVKIWTTVVAIIITLFTSCWIKENVDT